MDREIDKSKLFCKEWNCFLEVVWVKNIEQPLQLSASRCGSRKPKVTLTKPSNTWLLVGE